MRFYTKNHAHYCGIDLHAKTMYLCLFDRDGQILLHKNMRSCPEAFLAAVEPFREDLVVAVECIFTWYWLADLCRPLGRGPMDQEEENRDPSGESPQWTAKCSENATST